MAVMAIVPNAADEGIPNPFCQCRNWHTSPIDCSFGTYAYKKIRSTDRQVSVTRSRSRVA